MNRATALCGWMMCCASACTYEGAYAGAASADVPHNLILFVPDGLRAAIVDSSTAPTLARLRDEGVRFANSHSLFPTFTTANASAFATGHQLGDTGDFSNAIYTGLAIQNTVTPFLENDTVLRELNSRLGGNYLHEPSVIAAVAARAGPDAMSTAVIGKLGPVAIFDPTALAGAGTLIVDDSTGQPGKGIPIPPQWRSLIEEAKIKPDAPSRGDNGNAGTFIADLAQQQYFLEMTLKVVLPHFKKAGMPFVLVYWTRDPDGTQHTQGDKTINGPTSMTAIRSADGALAAIEQTLKALDLYDNTNIVVAADHGFSTIAKDSEERRRILKPGFLAEDLAAMLQAEDSRFKLFDPDADDRVLGPAGASSSRGNGVIGTDPRLPQVVVAANGGSDLIYLPVLAGPTTGDGRVPSRERRRIARLGARIVRYLAQRDYVSGLFVDEQRLGRNVPGALSLSDVGLSGSAATPRPAIIVNFRSYLGEDCDRSEKLLCAQQVSDTTYAAGGGMHGSFSRADTWNFMAARGPDFRTQYVDALPASNADIGTTLASLLHLSLVPQGGLGGRVLTEALRGHEHDPSPSIVPKILESNPSASGTSTIVRAQMLGEHVYFDAGGFKGRTLGLEPMP